MGYEDKTKAELIASLEARDRAKKNPVNIQLMTYAPVSLAGMILFPTLTDDLLTEESDWSFTRFRRAFFTDLLKLRSFIDDGDWWGLISLIILTAGILIGGLKVTGRARQYLGGRMTYDFWGIVKVGP